MSSALLTDIPRIYLASTSPRRRELLHQIGVDFDTLFFRVPPREDEDVSEAILPGESAEVYVVRVAAAKAEGAMRRIIWRKLRRQAVLSADTTLELDGEIIGKPDDVMSNPEIMRRVMAYWATRDTRPPEPLPGPTRDEMIAALQPAPTTAA